MKTELHYFINLKTIACSCNEFFFHIVCHRDFAMKQLPQTEKFHFDCVFSHAGNDSKTSLPNSKQIPAQATATLNVGEDDEITIIGYERSILKTAVTWLAFILSAGLIRLFMHWRRHWLLLSTHRPCGLSVAEKVLIREHFEGKHTVHYVKDVITMDAEWFQ